MKTHSHSSVVAVLATVLLFLTSARADTSAPLFTSATLTAGGTCYEWDSATEDGTTHVDVYLNGTSTLTATGRISNPALAVVSGPVSGYLQNGVYYLSENQMNSTGSWSFNGHAYSALAQVTHTVPDLDNGQLLTAMTETYTGEGGSFTASRDASGNGTISGTESGYVVSGNYYLNTQEATSTASSGLSSQSLFGTTFSFVSGSSFTTFDSSGQSTSGWTDQYASADGGTLTASYSLAGNAYTTSGWDPYVGSFAHSGSTPGFMGEARTAPSLAAAQLWVNGTLVSWQHGMLNGEGMITDSYAAPGGGLELTLSGQVRYFMTNGQAANVLINGANAGTLTQGGGFSTNGWSIVANSPNQTTPLFSSSTTLWVNGTEYPFVGGCQDNQGNRVDIYTNSSVGTLTIAGTTGSSGSGSVTVSCYGGSSTGSYSGGSFAVSGLDIQTSAPQPPPDPDPGPTPDPVYGPPAFWVRGRFYTRSDPSQNIFQSPDGHALSLSGAAAASVAFSGSDATGAFSGTLNADTTGLLTVTASDGTPVPVCAANAAGTLRLSGEMPPAELPPALMVTGGGIWQFLGTISENGGTVSCYGNATAASSTDVNMGGGCLLKIAASGTVTLINHLAATSATGSYHTQTHLFQTGTEASLPMPIYGVDPNSNNTPWGLAMPVNGPATFLVGNDVWRYTGDGADGAALYAGYFAGQQLALGIAGADGLRLVNVTDPVHGSTQGTLNDVRGSVRLRNGTMVYSGDMNGVRIQPTLNDSNLHTIAADLDITGNILSFGALSGDASTSGVTLQFSDTGTQALLNTSLSRSAAQWAWWRRHPNDVTSHVPTMALDSAFGLVLYDPANPAQATIQLNPNPGGASKFKGPVRITPSGDIGMGEFINGPQP